MPGLVRSLIVGGGIAPGTPATAGNIPQFAGGPPVDLLLDSILREVTGPPAAIIVGATDPASAATETFRTQGGFVSQGGGAGSLILGLGASSQANNRNAIVIGAAITATGDVTANNQSIYIGVGTTAIEDANNRNRVVIGHGITVPNVASLSNDMVLVGNRITGLGAGMAYAATCAIGNAVNFNNQTVTSAVLIGAGVTAIAPSAVNAVAVGADATVSQSGTAIGQSADALGGGSVAIGASANAGAQNNIAIGQLATCTSTSYQICIGASASCTAASTIAIGRGAAANVAGMVVFGSDNANAQYTNFWLGGVTSTTLDVSWNVRGPSGVPNTPAGNLTVNGPRGTGNVTTGGSIIFTTGLTAASGSTTQTARTRLTILQSGGLVVPASETTGRAAIAFQLTGGDVAFADIGGSTSQAAAAAGTLGNAPTAGDPGFWLAVRIAGALYAIPCWAV